MYIDRACSCKLFLDFQSLKLTSTLIYRPSVLPVIRGRGGGGEKITLLPHSKFSIIGLSLLLQCLSVFFFLGIGLKEVGFAGAEKLS